jgi:hypothetical protein
MISSKMMGSIYEIEQNKIKPRLQEIVDVIEGMNLLNFLASNDDDKNSKDDKSISLTFAEQVINRKLTIQTIIGKNYRANIYPSNNVELIFDFKRTFEESLEFKKKLNELGFNFQTRNGLKMKFVVEIPHDMESEKLTELFSIFEIK